MPMTSKEMLEHLKKNGFCTELKKGLEQAILKQAGLL